jgi:toluene monooxygenase system protein A
MYKIPREEWYDLTLTVNWTPKYVTEEELFPEEMNGVRV